MTAVAPPLPLFSYIGACTSSALGAELGEGRKGFVLQAADRPGGTRPEKHWVQP